MQRLRQAALFDLHAVDLDILRSNLESSSGEVHSRDDSCVIGSVSVTSVARGCGSLWIGDSVGRLHRTVLEYKLVDGGVALDTEKALDDEEQSPHPEILATDPLLSVNESSVFPLFNSRVSHILISSATETKTPRTGVFSDCEALLIIGWVLS